MRVLAPESLDPESLEKPFIRSFILPRRQERYIELLGSAVGRKKIKSKFAHFSDLDRRFKFLIPPGNQRADMIADMLVKKGASSSCYVWSESSPLDGSRVDLSNALSQTVGHAPGTLLLCIPDRLAYYEGEEKSQRYILQR
jgi:hypothetical protein